MFCVIRFKRPHAVPCTVGKVPDCGLKWKAALGVGVANTAVEL